MYANADLDSFASDDFDVKAWVNRACTHRPSEEPLDKFLAELEMKLQLSAEELEASLQEYTAQAMKRIPYAVQEVFRLQGDIQGMQDQVKSTLEQVGKDKTQAVDAVSYIAEIDRVKTNAESACSTLKEATELSDLFYKVEDVFAAKDLPKVADMLSTMRRSLSLVGEVPEFRAGKQKLKVLEDRLQSMVEGSFADALLSNKPDHIQNLAKILLAVNRFNVIESLYCSSRLTQVNIAFESSCQVQPDIVKGLAAFHNKFLEIISKESTWCLANLPDLKPNLLASLISQAFDRISPSIKSRLSTLSSLPILLSLQQQALSFSTQLQALLPDCPADKLDHVFTQIFSPLEHQLAQYGNLESLHLQADFSSILPPLPSPESDLESSLSSLSCSVTPAFSALSSALDRCLNVTGGTELPTLLPILDTKLASYLHQLAKCIQAIHDTHILPLDPNRPPSPADPTNPGAPPPPAPTPAPPLSDADTTTLLALVSITHTLSNQLFSLQTRTQQAVSTTFPSLQAAAARGLTPPLDLTSLRLHSAPQKLTTIAALSAALSSETPQPILPSASTQLEAVQQVAHNTVLSALMASIRQELHPFLSLPDWTRAPDPEAILPSFNTYPLQYITTVGEYLMTLPQQLEVLVVDEGVEGEDISDTLAAEWLDTVVTTAGRDLADLVTQLPALSQPGAAQLAADVEYFCNVMSALQVTVPPTLLAILLLAGVPEGQFTDAAKGALAEGGVDEGMVRALAKMKGVGLGDEVAAAGAAAAPGPTAGVAAQ